MRPQKQLQLQKQPNSGLKVGKFSISFIFEVAVAIEIKNQHQKNSQRFTFQTILFSLLWIVIPSYPVVAQNLIPNPGFEDYIECPITSFHYYDAANWETNVLPEPDFIEWHARAYIHACDPQVDPWWENELGDALIRTMYGYDHPGQRSYTRLIWTELLSAPEKDSLYYVEYTTAPSLIYYPDGSSVMVRSVPFNLGVKLEDETFDRDVGEQEPIEPDMIAAEGGVGQKVRNTMQIGNCFQATGAERYFLYGFFLDETPASDYTFIDISPTDPVIKWPVFTTDNFKLEKIKLEVCCDTIVCDRDLVDFSEYTSYYILPEKRIVWNDGFVGTKRSFPASGRYRFTMITNCGSVNSNWFNVEVEKCELKVFVPNAFSPNGDGINPYFAPQFTNDYEVKEIRLLIFNRWGNLVFQTTDLNSPGWDGKVGGMVQPQGVYAWYLAYTFMAGDQRLSRSEAGSLFLLK